MQSQLARPTVDEGAPIDGDDLFVRNAAPPAFDHVLIPTWSSAATREVGTLEPDLAARALDIVVRVASGRAGGVGARVKKLKGNDELWSTRLGIGHRVLFRFDPDRGRLHVEHIVPRKDLDKFLRRP